MYPEWHHNASPVANGRQSALTLPSVTGQDAGDYRVLVWNVDGFVMSSAATLTVLDQGSADTANVGADGMKTRLEFQSREGAMTVEVPAGWVLQSADQAVGPFLDEASSGRFIIEPKQNHHRFYRLRRMN